ncbi:MAG: Gfo/Idh/MocA family oxidoreductase [Ruthenibacterium sp.]
MIQIGILGAGGMGTVHLNNYARMEDCKVVALCDPSPAAEETARKGGLTLYTEIEKMLADSEVQLVDVCTPTFLHRTHVMAALNAGKYVICEKPLALTRADAQEMFALAREKHVQIFVGQVLQFAPSSKVLHSLVKSGEYGKMLDAQFLRLSACPRWVKNGWLFDKSKSGHLPFDLHIHDLDFLVSLLGKPDSYTYTATGREGLDYKEHYRFSYRFGETTVCAEAAWYNADIPFTATWRVYFEQAVVIFDGVTLTAYQFDHEPRVFDIEETLKIPTGINVPPTGMFYEELSSFLHTVETQPTAPSPREEELLTVIGILEQVVKES